MLTLNRINTLMSILVKSFVFLLPLFFIPVPGIALETSKILFTQIFVLVAGSLLLYKTYKTKEFVCIGYLKMGMLFLVPGVALLSALLSPNIRGNIFGYGYETSTVLFLFLLAAVAYIFAVTIKTKEEKFSLLSLSTLSVTVATLSQILILSFAQNKISFDIFSANVSLLGKVSDLAVFSSLGLILCIYAYQSFKGATKFLKFSLLALSGLFAFTVLAINYLDVYVVLSLAALFLVTRNKTKVFYKNILFYVSLFSFVAASLLLVGSIKDEKGGALYPRVNAVITYIPARVGLISGEVKPGLEATFSVADGIIRENALLGFGSNSFVYGWQKFKPAGVLASPYWDSNFLSGFSFVSSLMASLGILGIMSLLATYGYSIVFAVKKLRDSVDVEKGESMITTLVFLFLSIFSLVALPSATLLVFTFIALGVLYGKDSMEKIKSLEKPLAKTVFGFLTVVFISSFVYGIFTVSQKVLASVYFTKALAAINEDKNLNTGEDYIKKSLSFDRNDSTFRTLAELKILQSSLLITEAASSSPKNSEGIPQVPDEYKKKISTLIEEASLATTQAIEMNQPNLVNYLFAARIAEYIGNLKDVQDFYTKVLEKDPANPTAFLGLAKVSASQGNATSTKEFIAKALSSKSNYTQALLAASEVSAAENDATSTINFLAAAYNSNPSAIDILFRIAEAKLALGDTAGAVYAIEIALSQRPDSLETRYALATLYAAQSKNKEAVELLKSIQKDAPDSASSLEGYINSLSAGVNPFVKNEVTATSSNSSSQKATTTTTKK